jgi:hypothetical protein
MAGATNVEELVAAIRRAEAQRDANMEQVLRLKAELRELQCGRSLTADADLVQWQQRATDLAAVVAQLTDGTRSDALLATVERRARRAAAVGELLPVSVVEELERPAADPPATLSRAERRRLERGDRRRRP